MKKYLTLLEQTTAVISMLHSKFGLSKPEDIIPVVWPIVEKLVKDATTVDYLELDSYPTYEVGMLDFIHAAMIQVGLSSSLLMTDRDSIAFEANQVVTSVENLELIDLPPVHITPIAITTLLQAINTSTLARTLEVMVSTLSPLQMYALDDNNILVTAYPKDIAERLADRLTDITNVVSKNIK
jgi:hypothetical protein